MNDIPQFRLVFNPSLFVSSILWKAATDICFCLLLDNKIYPPNTSPKRHRLRYGSQGRSSHFLIPMGTNFWGSEPCVNAPGGSKEVREAEPAEPSRCESAVITVEIL